MVEDITEKLNVSNSAIGFCRRVAFLFKTDAEMKKIIDECSELSRREIDKYLFNFRISKVKDAAYSSEDDFIQEYNGCRKSALERLFQEEITERKLSKLKSNDPSIIYKIHSKLPIGIFFMTFVAYM